MLNLGIFLLVKPYPIEKPNFSDDGSIGVFGASGNVGSSLVRALIEKKWGNKVLLHARSTESALRIDCLLDDSLAPESFSVTQEADLVLGCELIIICSGVSTKTIVGINKKNSLMIKNQEIISSLLSGAFNKTILLVTNPTTDIVSRNVNVNNNIILGVGVENDNIRFRHHMRNNNSKIALAGAHHFKKLIPVIIDDKDAGAFSSFNRARYENISHSIDQKLDNSNFNSLIKYKCKLPGYESWWASQRLNTIVNSTCWSCAQAIINIVSTLKGDNKQPVAVERLFRHSKFYSVFGWPCHGKGLSPVEAEIPAEYENKFNQLLMSYAI